MANLFPEIYRNILLKRFRKIRKRNASYSMRAFARHLGVSHTLLAGVCSGKRALSSKLAPMMAEKLGLRDAEKKAFLLSVELANAKSPEFREFLQAKLSVLVSASGKRFIGSETLAPDHADP